MKPTVLTACLVLSGAAFAQEIGTELPAEQQPPPTTQPQPSPYDNPYATPPPPPPTTQQPEQAATSAATVPGPKAGSFGIRAGFGGSSVPAAPTSSTDPAPGTPTIGLKYIATDSVAITFDVGLALGLGNRVSFGFGTGFGVQAYLGSPEKPIRPFFLGGVTFGKTLSSAARGWVMEIDAGFGGEYFFSDHFSLQGSAVLGVPLNLDALNTVTLATFQPGVGANFYF